MNTLLKHAIKKGICSEEEYRAILDAINNARTLTNDKANVLVFGLGYDSPLWLAVNQNGNTFFLEDDKMWIEKCSVLPGIVPVAYRTEYWDNEKIYNADLLHMPLPDYIEDLSWDVIVVDGPVGAINGRMKSIHNAHRLAVSSRKSGKHPAVFVHDYDRPSEKAYVNHYFKKYGKQIIDRLVKIQL